MHRYYSWMVFTMAIIYILPTVIEAGKTEDGKNEANTAEEGKHDNQASTGDEDVEFCNKMKKVFLESKSSEYKIKTDPKEYIDGKFIIYKHLAIRTDAGKEYADESRAEICPFTDFIREGTDGRITESMKVKNTKGTQLLKLENWLTQDDPDKAIFSLTGEGQQHRHGKDSLKQSMNGYFIFIHADSSVLGYTYCAQKKGLHRVAFSVALKQDKRDDVKETENNEVKKALADVEKKIIEIIKLYKKEDETAISKQIRNFPESCPKD